MAKPDDPGALKIAEYRAKAMEAIEHAATCTDMEIRACWEAIAASYHDMAERLEQKALGS
jgi:hypothetical protein